jgi:hypothetical protein
MINYIFLLTTISHFAHNRFKEYSSINIFDDLGYIYLLKNKTEDEIIKFTL